MLFFPKSSFQYANTLKKGRGDEGERRKRALANAWNSFHVGVPALNIPPEGNDPYIRQLFGEADPLAMDFSSTQAGAVNNNFQYLAEVVYMPLLEYLETVS